jgi:hypothetical protein
MDDDRFDALTAGLASAPTRRTALRVLALLVAGLASLFGWIERHPAETKKRQRRHTKPADKRRRKRKGKGKKCSANTKRCDGACIAETKCCGGCSNDAICLEGVCVKPLYPDLRTHPPDDLQFDTLFDTLGNVTHILRFANTIWNAGEGRLELEGDPEPPAEPHMARKVYQNLYDAPIGGNLVSHKLVARDLIYHPSHEHFHLADFASYLLLALDTSSGIYRGTTKEGTKTSFCVMDSYAIDETYPAQFGNDTCETSDRQGMTPGWADTYSADLVDQWVVLGESPLSDGEYAIQSTADPERLLDEGGGNRESNNSSVTYFTVQGGAIHNVREQP